MQRLGAPSARLVIGIAVGMPSRSRDHTRWDMPNMGDKSPGGTIIMGPMNPDRAHKSQFEIAVCTPENPTGCVLAPV